MNTSNHNHIITSAGSLSSSFRLSETAFNATSFLKVRENFSLFFFYSVLLYMKKLSNTVSRSNKLMLTYFFRALFIYTYFKTKHSNETFHLGFYSLSNDFSYRKHISSKCNISVLTISGKSRNIKIIAPSPLFYYQLPPSHHHHILWYSFFFVFFL